MASTDIRQFLFYFKYLWSPADFTNLQLWLQETTAGIAEGAFGAAVLKGLAATPGSGLNVLIDAGIAVGDEGQLMVNGSQTAVSVTAPVAAPKRSLIVMRPVLVSETVIPQPDNPANSVPLHQQITFNFAIIEGTENANPVYPAKLDGDCIVCGLLINPGATNIVNANLERSPISLPRKQTHALNTQKSSYNIVTTDDHLDWDLTGGAATGTLPSSLLVPGQDFTIVKIDATSNPLTVAGQDLISGQSRVILDSQWQTLHVRSVGLNGWRIL